MDRGVRPPPAKLLDSRLQRSYSLSERRFLPVSLNSPLASAEVAELADAPDSKSGGAHTPWGFDSPLRHQNALLAASPHGQIQSDRYGRRRKDPERREKMAVPRQVRGRLLLLGEIVQFLGTRKRWWLLPIVGILIVLGIFLFVLETGVGPMIYALF
jgi:hypothetical protein